MNKPKMIDGDKTREHTNLAAIRRYVGKHPPDTIELTENLTPLADVDWSGKLLLRFDDGKMYVAEFASFAIMLGWVRRWRNVYGRPLYINGVTIGAVSFEHPELVSRCYPSALHHTDKLFSGK